MKTFLKTSLLTLAAALCCLTATAQPKVIAHRGYWKAPNSAQNSLASWIKADSIGCYGSEFDVWLTADDQLIVNHDRLYRGIYMTQSKAETICNLKLSNGETIPTLEAYLQLAQKHPKTRLILELKSHNDPARENLAAEKVAALLQAHGLLDRTDIIAFSLNACLAFRKLMPQTHIQYLNGDLTPQEVHKLGLNGIDYSFKTLQKHPEWIKEAHELGLKVNVWTVNKEENLRKCIEWKVDYITTDEPELLQKLLL